MTDKPGESEVQVTSTGEARLRARGILKGQSCFAGCADGIIDALLERSAVMRFAKGETLYRHGEPGDSLTVVLSGSLKVVNVTGDAKEVVLAFLAAGALIGEIAVLDGHPRTANVVAMEPVEAVTIYRRDMLPILKTSPDALMALLLATCDRLRATIGLVECYALETEARVASGLVRLAREHGREKGSETTIEIKVNQRDLGSHLGLTRETVSRTLSDLRATGLIEVRGQNIVILDAERLSLLAEGLGD